ncbi:MAG: HAMP domain-containing histidine kinase [Chloroflexota bacterium]|nr:HAMP domain-containing histidine kinase [Chloroflexota bacterium]
MTGAVMFFVGVMSYAAHARSEYAEADRTLVAVSTHKAAEYQAAAGLGEQETVMATPLDSVGMSVYDRTGRLELQGPNAGQAPSFSVLDVLRTGSPAPYDVVAYLAPLVRGPSAAPGRFGLLTGSDGQRWRVLVRRLDSGEYLAAAMSLAPMDASVEAMRVLLPLVVLVGAGITLVFGWIVATRALRPVGSITDIAGLIAHSHNFGQRVPTDDHQDELGRLATTFNGMLQGLETCYVNQQRFVADASHELRAPLTIIQANLELLERRPDMAAGERAEAVREASRETKRLSRMVADMLVLARADAGIPIRRQRVDLAEIVLDSVVELRPVAKGQRLEIEHLDPVAVDGDPDRLKQLVLILLDNAVKYTPAKGRVSVALTASDVAQIEVADSGVGIAPEDLPHVFERFYRADPARSRDAGGSGLGLSIADALARQHGGDVRLVSEQGKGTVVTVRLPTSPGAGQAASGTRGTPHPTLTVAG